jgi:hypothetical protein
MLAVLAALRAKVRGFIRLGPGVGLSESANPGLRHFGVFRIMACEAGIDSITRRELRAFGAEQCSALRATHPVDSWKKDTGGF